MIRRATRPTVLLSCSLLLAVAGCRSSDTAAPGAGPQAGDGMDSDRIAQDGEPPPPRHMQPAAVELPPESRPAPARPMRGVFTSAHGVDSFVECGQAGSWLVSANETVQQQLHARTVVMAEQLRQPPAPVYLEATGELLGADAAGPAQDVRNVVRLGSIARIDEHIPADCQVR